jgi:hypothetical protein
LRIFSLCRASESGASCAIVMGNLQPPWRKALF